MRRPAQPNHVPLRVLGYIRVSGAEQANAGTSLDGQRERIVAWCAERGYPSPEIRVEVESASEERLERRLELHRLTADARKGDLVVVALLDRWSRDIVYGVGSIRKLVRADIGWYAIAEQIDAATPHGDEQLGLRMWFAESERKRIRDRTVGRREELRAQGLWANGPVPFGYRRGDRGKRKHLHLEIDPENAPHVVEMYRLAISGKSVRAIADWLATIPGAPRHAAQVHRCIRGRHYLGEMRSGGEWIRGTHPPIITEATWQLAKDSTIARRAGGRLPTGERTADLLLRGILRCGICGRRASVAFGKFGHRYYVCAKRRHKLREGTCEGPYVRTDRIDAIVVQDVLGRIRELHAELAEVPVTAAPMVDLAAARGRVEARIARAVQLAVDGAISAAELVSTRRRLDAELVDVANREADAARVARAEEPVARATIAAAMADLGRTWGGLTVEERREAIGLLVARVEVLLDKSLRWTWRPVSALVSG